MQVKMSNTSEFITEAKSFTKESLEKQKKQITYRDCSSSILMPSRGMIHVKVMRAQFQLLQHWPMNQKKVNFDAIGMEVGAAYQYLTEQALEHSYTRNFPFVITMEDDNLPPIDGAEKLFDAIHTCVDCGEEIIASSWECPNGHRGLDGVSGLYYAKVDPPIAMAFGDPKSEELEFRPRQVAEAVEAGQVIEVNGIANGFSVFRAEMFRKLPKPWWRTTNGTEKDEDGAATQDLRFCRMAKEQLGSRFAVHCGVKVGHLDINSGEIF